MLTIRRLPEGTCQPAPNTHLPTSKKTQDTPNNTVGRYSRRFSAVSSNQAHGHLNTSRTWTAHDCICDLTVKAVPAIVCSAETAYPLSSLGFTPFDFNATVSLWVSETT